MTNFDRYKNEISSGIIYDGRNCVKLMGISKMTGKLLYCKSVSNCSVCKCNTGTDMGGCDFTPYFKWLSQEATINYAERSLLCTLSLVYPDSMKPMTITKQNGKVIISSDNNEILASYNAKGAIPFNSLVEGVKYKISDLIKEYSEVNKEEEV